MSDFQTANVNGSMPTEMVAVESRTMNCYLVPVDADCEITVTGYVRVYAASEDEAIDKVLAKIDAGTLDDDLELEDPWSGTNLPYRVVKHIEGVYFQIDTSSVEKDDQVTVEEVLRADIAELEKQIIWNGDALARRKAFLESLAEPETKAA